MEDERYYTPSLEEIHIGTEIEFAIENRTKEPFVTEWLPTTVDAHMMLDIRERSVVMEECYRIKKLDTEDITELGWERPNEVAQVYSIGDFALAIMKNGSVGIAESVKNHWVSVFRGKIANKSVLKSIMEMVGITKKDGQ